MKQLTAENVLPRGRRVRTMLLWTLVAVAAIALPTGAGAHTDGASRTATRGPVGGIVHSRLAPAPPALPAAGTPNLRYGGGPVMRTNTVYAIYWLPAGSTVSADYQSLLNGYFQNVADSSGATDDVYSNDTQYYDTTGPIAHTATFAGSYVDTVNAIPKTCKGQYHGALTSCVTEADEQQEILRAIDAAGWTPGPTTMFFLFTPRNVGSCIDVDGSDLSGVCSYRYYCAYHSTFDTTVGGTPTPVIWANQPYPTAQGFPADVCDVGVHPNGDIADATINVVSHEHIESITDPDIESGWFDSQGEEISDKCAWEFGDSLGTTGSGLYNQQIGTGKYYLQMEWSNALTGCVLRQPDPRTLLISSFSPSKGVVGTPVTIYGDLLGDATAVAFNGAPASFTIVSPNELRAVVPADGTTGPITVTTPGGDASSDESFSIVPSITGLSVASGQVGDEVVISGTSLTDTSSVKFGVVEDSTFVVDSPSTITAHVPDGALTAPIVVTTPDRPLKGPVFKVRPTLDPLAVSAGAVGTTLTLTGKTLAGTSKVAFGAPGALGQLLTVTSAKVTVKVPANAVGGPITVTNPGGSTATGIFHVLPKITSFSPTSGVADSVVTISGSGLAGTATVSFDGTPATIASVTGTQVKARVPALAATGPITLLAAVGDSASTAKFKPLPKLTGVAPDPPQAGQQITVAGGNLLGATSLKLGGTALQSLIVDSAIQVRATLPPNAATAPLTIKTANGTSAAFTLRIRPTIASFAPDHGPAGTIVVLTGKALKSPTKVTFGSLAATAQIVSSSYGQLKVKVPANAVTGPITVTTAGGTTVSSGTYTFP